MTSQSTGAVRERRPTPKEIAEAIAPGWERRRPFVEEVSAPVRAWMVRALEPQARATVLELACGVGDTGFEVARDLGDGGRLISSDFATGMVGAARRRAAELGVENVDFRVIDAHDIPLDRDSVDGVLCRFGYMLMEDPARALAETRRVLRPGGRLALGVWGAPERNPNFAVLGGALVEAGHLPPPSPEAPGPFSLADADRLTRLLRGAGFEDVRTEPVDVRFVFAGVDECVAIAADTAGPIGLALQRLSGEQRDAVAASLREGLRAYEADGGYALPGQAICAVAS